MTWNWGLVHLWFKNVVFMCILSTKPTKTEAKSTAAFRQSYHNHGILHSFNETHPFALGLKSYFLSSSKPGTFRRTPENYHNYCVLGPVIL